MKPGVKTLVLFTCFCLLFQYSPAQLRLPAAGGLAADVRKILEDYPNAFANLMGEKIADNPQSADYRCTIKIPKAEQCFFTRYSSRRTITSWEATMLTTEDFNKAEKEFRSLFQQLNNLGLRFGDGRQLKFRGDYEKPDESLKFSSVLLQPGESDPTLRNLRLEILLSVSEPLSWKVKILLYEKEKEDEERGAVRE